MFRLATPADLPRLIEVSLSSFGPVTWAQAVDRVFGPLNGHDWRERWRRRVEKAFREQIFLVLEENNQILGYACGTVDPVIGLGHIDILAVDPAVQGKGYGRRILYAMEDHFLSLGANYVTLESLIDNEVANSLYRREGYQPLATQFNWFKKIERSRGA